MAAGDLATELAAAVRAVFAPVAAYLALVDRNSTHGSVGALLARPDVQAVLTDAFAEARSRARAAVQDAWGQHDPETAALLAELLSDVDRAYNDAAYHHLLGDIRHAWHSVPMREFVPGVTPPGAVPARESAAERARAVQDAVEEFARRTALRNSLSVDVAEGIGQTLADLDDAPAGARKQWRTSRQPPDDRTCFWCRRLNGVIIPLHASFAHHLGLPADLTGHGHLTQPPRPYRGWLQGPPAHPRCRCRLLIVPPGDEPEDVSQAGGQAGLSPPGFLAAADVRALPEGRYRALVEFLRAAIHELGQALHRLGRVVRHGSGR